ncbi:MAG: PrsW family intramembrane metalloprotease [Anaerolineae bacterium]|nr:PrsW family intramembrane metalloprotease [Anaerolineae bacterium]
MTVPLNAYLVSIVAAAIPVLIFVAVVYWADQYEKEPGPLLLAVFFWGALPGAYFAVRVRGMFELPLNSWIELEGSWIIIGAPVVEETIKAFALLLLVLFYWKEFDTPLDGFIYGAMIGLGFAWAENVLVMAPLYAADNLTAWWLTWLGRGVFFGFNHALFTSMTGLGVAFGRLSSRRIVRWLAPFCGWFAAVLLHTIHNLGTVDGIPTIITPLTDSSGLVVLIVIVVWALLQERRWIRDYLKKELEYGTIRLSQYEIACSIQHRTARLLHVLSRYGWRRFRRESAFYHRCSELAYLKHHYELRNGAANLDAVAAKRREVTYLSAEL